MRYNVEYTDTFAGEANYCWVKRASVTMPDMSHYGWDGSTGWSKANAAYHRELMRKAKAAMGLTGARGRVSNYGDVIEFVPWSTCTVMFVAPDFETS
jgi:hypothetical protein